MGKTGDVGCRCGLVDIEALGSPIKIIEARKQKKGTYNCQSKIKNPWRK
jgi:hypothetical protein